MSGDRLHGDGGGPTPAGSVAPGPGTDTTGRWSPARRAGALFLAVTAAKLIALAVLFSTGAYRPFVGSNAADHYLPIADRLLSEGRFNGPDSRPDSKVPPGYPLLIAAIKAVGGGAYLHAIVYAQILIGLGAAWAIFVLARRVSSERVGILAGVAWLLYPPEVMISTWITAETVFTGLLALSMVLLYVGITDRRNACILAAGIALGVATHFRATCLYFPILFLIVRGVSRGRRGLLEGLCFAVSTYSLILPWMVRNYLVLDDRIAVSVGAGSVVLQGSDERFFTIAGKSEHYPAAFREAAEAGVTKPAGDKESAIDAWLMKVGFRQYENRLRDRPLSLVPFLLHKLVRIGYGTESGSRGPQLVLGFCSLLVIPAALWQVWRWRRDGPEAAALFGSLAAYFVLLHWVTLPEYRYIHPLFPFLILATVQRVSSAFTRFAGEVRKPA